MADANMGLGTTNPFLGQNNPYLQSIIDSSTGDLVKQYGLTALPASNAALVRSGSFGNSGLQELQSNDASTLQKNIGDLSSKLRFNDYTQQQQEYNWQKGFDQNQSQFDEGTRRYDQDFSRGVYNDSFSQNQQNLQTGLGLLSYLGGANTSDINNSTTQQNTPLNYLNQFTQVGSQIGGQGGSATTQQGTSSNPLATALGGAQLGSSWWNSKNAGSTSPPSGYSSWDSYNYGNSGGGDTLGNAGAGAGWW